MAVRLDPKYVNAYIKRAEVWEARKYHDKAIADYSEAVRVDPECAIGFNGLAWLWATSPDANCRDGRRAVECGQRACELTQWKDGNTLDTLAAAYAEAGNFDKAVEWQQKANEKLAGELKHIGEQRLKLYRDKKAFRQT